MKHLDLFSGIGGFAYAADQVFGDVDHIFCDNEPFAQAVLKKHWPESEIFDDIRTITDTASLRWRPGAHHPKKGRQARRGHQRPATVDLVTGGFPCQPFSAAGLRRGTADARHLWPEMLRVIRLTAPRWVIGENVRGITNWNDGVVFEQVCADLEAAGYEVQPFIIPAVAVNAPHRRDRVWFVAHAIDDRSGRAQRKSTAKPDRLSQKHRPQNSATRQSERANSVGVADRPAANTTGKQRPGGMGLERQPHQKDSEPGRTSWNRNWVEVAAELCSVDDGLPARVGGLELTKPQHRAAQIKAYGNAIVPQVAMEIMQAIKETEEQYV